MNQVAAVPSFKAKKYRPSRRLFGSTIHFEPRFGPLASRPVAQQADKISSRGLLSSTRRFERK
jgi:hypothetical protein